MRNPSSNLEHNMTNEAHEQELPPGTDSFEDETPKSANPMTEVSFDEFRSTGLLLLVNQFLHIFGFALACECDDEGRTSRIFICRVTFRGFSETSVSKAYVKVSEYLTKNAEILLKEAKS